MRMKIQKVEISVIFEMNFIFMKRLTIIILFLFNTIYVKGGDPPVLISVEPNSTEIVKYGLFELDVFCQTSVINRFDYDSVLLRASFRSPSNEIIESDGFYYQHFQRVSNNLLEPVGDPFWKLRFTPTMVGKWYYTVYIEDSFGIDSIIGLQFDCVSGNNGGFVRSLPGSSYLQDDAGKSVFLIGENIAWANEPDGSDRMTYYLHKLHDHEMNFAKLMMTPWGYQIEWIEGGLRNYMPRQRQAYLLDSIFRLSDNLGIYIQMAFSIHNELNFGYPAEDWTSNPYNVNNGGMCVQAQEFFSNEDAKAAFKNRLRYLNARWGYATNLFGWELLSEADNFPWYSQNSNQIAAWSGEMASYISEKDINKHLVSVGFALSGSNPLVWNHPDVGFTQMHLYDKVPDIEGDVFRQTGLYLQKYNKPVLVGEFGLGHEGDSLVAWDPEGIALHNTLWTSALSGSPATVVPWFWENYIDAQNLYPLFTPVARFMEDENPVEANFEPKHLQTFSDVRDDFVITPKYSNLSQKSPSRFFQLQPTGQMVPAADSLVQFLFGPLSLFANLRNPPEISGYWPEASIVTIETGVQAINSILQVSIDGIVIFEQTVAASTEYNIAIPQGLHTIRIDNIGSGFFSLLELYQLTFHDFLPQLRAFGLVNSSSALVWLHNRNHHWLYLKENGNPPPPVNGQLALNLNEGLYHAEWFNTREGYVDSVSQFIAGDEGLLIDVNYLEKDVALKLSMLTSLAQKAEVHAELVLYPNPSNEGVYFAFELMKPNIVNLQIFDVQGKIQFDTIQRIHRSGVNTIYWNGMGQNGFGLNPGVYIYRLFTGENRVFNGRLIRY